MTNAAELFIEFSCKIAHRRFSAKLLKVLNFDFIGIFNYFGENSKKRDSRGLTDHRYHHLCIIERDLKKEISYLEEYRKLCKKRNSMIESFKDGGLDFRKRAAIHFFWYESTENLQPMVELLKEALESDNKDYDLIRWAMIALFRNDEIRDPKLAQLILRLIHDAEFRKWVDCYTFEFTDGNTHFQTYFEYGAAIHLLYTAKATEHIIKLLKDENSYIQRAATIFLSRLEPLKAIVPLLDHLKDPDHVLPGNLALTISAICEKHYIELEDALIRTYRRGGIPIGALKEVIGFRGLSDLRNSKARLQYLIGGKEKTFIYEPSFDFDDLCKVPECCESTLKPGDEAIAVFGENKEKISIHTLSCPEVDPAYWS